MMASIGKQLGAIVALLENDLSQNPDDVEALKKLALASEAYRNFSQGGLEGFGAEFKKGYERAASDLEGDPVLGLHSSALGAPTRNDGP